MPPDTCGVELSKILIDTSSILYGFENRLNVFDIASEAFPGSGLYVSKGIIRELDKLSTNKGSRGASARISLRALANARLKVVDDAKSGDAWILDSAKNADVKAITNDTALAKRLKSLGVKVFKLARDGKLK